MLREENAQLHQKDRLAESLVKFAFQDEQKKTDFLERENRNLKAEKTLIQGKTSTAAREVLKLEEALIHTSERGIMED